MSEFKVILAGGRDFTDYGLLSESCDKYLQRYLKFDMKQYHKNPNLEIVSGTAPGADSLGETYAIKNLINVKPFPALWKDLDAVPCKIRYRNGEPYNVLAGFNRNKQMAEYASALIAFWNGSSGTKDMIGHMKRLNKPCRIVRY